jgi:hypothetical protein
MVIWNFIFVSHLVDFSGRLEKLGSLRSELQNHDGPVEKHNNQ